MNSVWKYQYVPVVLLVLAVIGAAWLISLPNPASIRRRLNEEVCMNQCVHFGWQMKEITMLVGGGMHCMCDTTTRTILMPEAK